MAQRIQSLHLFPFLYSFLLLLNNKKRVKFLSTDFHFPSFCALMFRWELMNVFTFYCLNENKKFSKNDFDKPNCRYGNNG
jgi:hypothetical protein